MPNEVTITRWADVWLKAAEAREAARSAAMSNASNDALEIARWEANGRLHTIENEMANEVLLMLRQAFRWRTEAIRHLIIEIIADEIEVEVTKQLNKVREAYAKLAERVKLLEASKVAKPTNGVRVAANAIPVGK